MFVANTVSSRIQRFVLFVALLIGLAAHGLNGVHGINGVYGANWIAEEDWPQWRGPHRDGHAAPQPLLQEWPDGGPKLSWSFSNAGTGYSEVSVVGDKLFTLGRRGAENLLICLDADRGTEIWTAVLGRGATSNDYSTGWGDGPRSSATIEGEFVYALSDIGDLGCFQKSDGKTVWSVNLVTDFGGGIPQWGYSESVLIDGDRVIVTPGGSNFLIGLDKKSGKKIWSSEFASGAQYCSVLKHSFEGVPVYLTACEKGLVGIHCETGKLLFLNDKTGNGTAVVSTAVVSGDLVYHSSAYKAGNVALRITVDQGVLRAEQVYHQSKESMENHHGGYFLNEGAIIGFSKSLRGVWMAQDLATGRVLWSKKVGKSSSGSIAFADGLAYCFDDQEGVCVLAQVTRSGFKQVGQLTIPEQTALDRKQGAIWTHPVIANRKLFIRDQEKIFAYAIARE